MANQVYVLFTWLEDGKGQISKKVVMNYSDYFLSDLSLTNTDKGQELARQYVMTRLGGNPSKVHHFIRVDYQGEVRMNQNTPKDNTSKSKKIESSEKPESSNDDAADDDWDDTLILVFKILVFPFKLLWKIIVWLWKALMWFGRR